MSTRSSVTASVCLVLIVHLMVFPSSASGEPPAPTSSVSSTSLLSSHSTEIVKKEHVCPTVDIRSRTLFFDQLINCTVVEGSVKIILIEHVEEADWQRFSYPKLREITGFLLLYRVYGLRSLSHMFPNLAVIRGEFLFFNYALVIFELPNLEDVGLHGLTRIVRGGVRLEKNAQLCYIDTVDWQRVATSVKVGDNFILENKKPDECVNFCPKNDSDGSPLCPVIDVKLSSGEKVPQELCWNDRHCQKVCPTSCNSSNACYATNITGHWETKCCHAQCIGGCNGPLDSDCFACANILYKGRCIPNCPPNTYEFRSRRCLVESECRAIVRRLSASQKDVFWKLYDGKCVAECPRGFTEAKEDRNKCERCQGHCPKVCGGVIVDNVAAMQQLKGCTIINGALEINLRGGDSLASELEENLGMIEEITHYLKIARSYALVSLRFLKSLRVIHGERRHNKRFAFFVLDNQNLQDIWDFETHPNLTITHINGTVFFHFNRKLCMNIIDQFVDSVGIRSRIQPTDISETSNGDQVACSTESVELIVTHITPTYALINWKNYSAKDPRTLLSWVINYRQANDGQNVTMYSSRDACGTDVWKTSDVKLDADPKAKVVASILYGLEPFTRYAVYVQTYSIATVKVGAMSPIIYFTTKSEMPSPVRDITVDAKYPGELHVSWKEPANQNGNVTHYYVYWQSQSLAVDKFDQRNYCKDKLRLLGKSKETIIIPNGKNSSSDDGRCCSCPKTKTEINVEETERRYQIEFENFLHNSIYRKPLSVDSTSLLTKVIRKKRSTSSGKIHSSRKKRFLLNQSDIENFAKRNPEVYKSLLQNHSELPNATTEGGGAIDGGPDFVETHEAAIVYGKTEIILTNLKHFQEYSIEVIACHEYIDEMDDKLCSNRAIISGRTLANASADAIDERNITVGYATSAVGETNIVLTWKEPISPNGLVVLYEIELVKTDVPNYKSDVLCIPHQQYRLARGSYEVQGIKAGTWSFRLRATSLAGSGPWTELQDFEVAAMDGTMTPSLSSIIGVVLAIFAVIFIAFGIGAVVVKKKFSARLRESSLTVVTYNPNYTIPEKEYVPDEWEVPREKIEIIRELGQGSFGMVYEGIATDLIEGEPVIRVAIKTVNETASIHDRYSFLNEASIMKAFSSFHVVKLLGVVSQGQPVLVVMELMSNGDLKTFLRMRRPEEENGLEAPTLSKLLEWAGEIADGMAYLTSIKYVHRDLAARNCMVSADQIVKIGDFGMTRDIYATDYYRKGTKGLLPVRWMAPESLKDGLFSSRSDVWSYGVVLWEMATLAAQPYQGLSNEQVLHYVIDGSIMERPEGCPDRLYDLMLHCWQVNPKNRPTFYEIIEDLSPNLPESFRNSSFYYTMENDDEDDDANDDDYTSADSTADVNRDVVGCDDDNDDSDLIHSKTPLHPAKSSEQDALATDAVTEPQKLDMIMNSRGFLMPVRLPISSSVMPSPLSCRRVSGSSSIVSDKTSVSDIDLKDGPLKRANATKQSPLPPYKRDLSMAETTNDALSSANDKRSLANHRSLGDSQPDVVRGGLLGTEDSSKGSNHLHRNGLLNGLLPPPYTCRTSSPC